LSKTLGKASLSFLVTGIINEGSGQKTNPHKVFIVTGATSGVGQSLAQILYSHNAKVYIGARSPSKALAVISHIKSQSPNSTGDVIFLRLDLEDLTTIKSSAQDFLSKEDRLDVLWNNAGVMGPVPGVKTEQGYELQLGTNTVAPFLLTKLLTPMLVRTAKVSPPGSVRVVWVSSSAAELLAPPGGLDVDNLDYKIEKPFPHVYGVSKAGNVLHSKEFARLYKGDGVVSLVGQLSVWLRRSY
jgi:retinol dehydrogenase 12